ncbi:MAG: hypothetical protein ACR2N3_10785 [Pyrinomonadaceae bacterium]
MKEHRFRVKLSVMARILSRCPKQFKQDVKKYDIPHLGIGRDLLFYPQEVEEYLSELTKARNSKLKEVKEKTIKNKSMRQHSFSSQIISKKEGEQSSEPYFKSLLGLR